MKPQSLYPRAILFGVLALIALVAVVILWAVLLMTAIDPGRAQADYARRLTDAYVVVGIPLLLLFGWLAARRLAAQHGLIAGLVTALVPSLVEIFTQPLAGGGGAWSAVALSVGSKLLAGMAGGWLASRRSALPKAESDPT